MTVMKVDFVPGVNKEGTRYTNQNQYFDSDKVRFRKGRPESIGGWEKFTNATFLGVCRSMFRWFTLASVKYHTIGTHLKYYILEGNTFADITPIRSSGNLGNNPFTTTNESKTVTVTHSSHGAFENDYVTVASADTTNGIPAGELNTEHQILTVPNVNSYTIAVSTTAATSSGTGGGTTPATAAYQLNAGLETSTNGAGFGVDTWGAGGMGDAAVPGIQDRLRIYHQDNWGEDLLFNVRGGSIYYWDSSDGTSTRATLLSAESGADDVPSTVTQILVAQTERHVIAYGSTPKGSSTHDPLLVRWSDQENNVDWDPTATNTSGSQRLGVGSKIIRALSSAGGEILIWTDLGLYSQQFVGPPYVYGFKLIAGDVSIISPNAVAFVNGLVYWMDANNFYSYSGSSKILQCSLLDFVFSDMNNEQFEQVFAAPNVQFNEVSWFYCSGDSTQIDRYVTYNYEEGIWYPGTLDRSAWIDAADTEVPLATSNTGGILYKHESGVDDDGSAISSYIESSDFDVGDGDEFSFINRIIPDIDFSKSASNSTKTGSMILKTRNYPGNSLSTNSTSSVTDTTEQSFIRARSRQAVLRWESSAVGVAWRMGVTRMDIKPDGKR
jgi:hypothetical protein